MYVLVCNNRVLLGPREWSKAAFERSLREDARVTVALPPVKTDAAPIKLASDVIILPVRWLPAPTYDSRTQIADGPYWEFTSTEAIGRYEPRDKNVDVVKSEMRATVADLRWRKEVGGIKTVIQGTEVELSTQRGERDIYAQALLLGADGKTWKFPNNIWLTLSLDDLRIIVNAVANHVSQSFVWESTISNAIDSATTLDELRVIDLS